MAQRNESTPGKLWYGLQYTKGILHTTFAKGASTDIKKVAIYGAAAAGLGMAAVATIFIPFIPGVLPLVCAGGAAVSARNTSLKFKMVKNHPKFFDFMKNKEREWLSSKTKAPIGARVKAFCKRTFGKGSLPFTVAGKWLGYGAAAAGAALGVAGGLHMGGVIAIPAAVLAPVGVAATAVGLTAASGLIAAVALCALAVPAGIVTARLCDKATKKLRADYIQSQASSRPAPAFKSGMDAAKSSAPSADNTSEFNSTSAQTSALSAARQAAAAERARKREAEKKNNRSNNFGL